MRMRPPALICASPSRRRAAGGTAGETAGAPTLPLCAAVEEVFLQARRSLLAAELLNHLAPAPAQVVTYLRLADHLHQGITKSRGVAFISKKSEIRRFREGQK